MSSFSEGLRRDVERRLRAAIHKLSDRAIDIEVEQAQAYERGERDGATGEVIDLDGHIWALRRAIASAVAWGHFDLRPDAETALRVAEEPRKRRHACAGGCSGHRHAPTQPKASQALPKRPKVARKPPPGPKRYNVDVPEEAEWEERALSVAPRRGSLAALPPATPVVPAELTLDRFNAGAHRVAPPEPAAVEPRGAGSLARRKAPALQEPLFGRPLMLPAYVPGRDEG